MTAKSTRGASSPHSAAVVYNPIKVDLDAIKAAVATLESETGWAPTTFHATSKEDPGVGATKEALDAGADVVIVAGGDGTVRAVAEAIHDSDAALALMPSGTGNLFARNLGLPLDDIEGAVRTAFTGVDRAVDIGLIDIRDENEKVSKHAFVVMAGLGLDAKMLANTDDELKKRIGWLAYVSAIAKALTDSSELRLDYRLDSRRSRSARAHTVIVGNCGSLTANVLLLPDAAPDNGFFDVAVMRPQGIIGWVQILVKVLWENGVLRRIRGGNRLTTRDVRALSYVKAKQLTVRLSTAEEIELDGDGFGRAIAFKTRIKAGGLRIRMPQVESK
ncbi:NAD(+)/NADH kinase [Salinibacterium sp. NSLL150]|uniref:diacylglycerol/lipid kinase family protein n=1 Tax=unclassified Salinibacterium TaxID=2632331 RepID=UPI0018CCCAC4|nr:MULTISPECIES: diacylglycerol kinase family protein [unclassified Salinibacterium]MBH0099325.1 NAD(+)/NADH kinase [Salinibacterium sp. NSLL35]MBH0102079.1 NAD(+)/NADH kinase [Salinibacterium sp. NSLL150]MBH0104839.1 NAD(+)/NADH kinase [Salinibacterium sp. NSLL16]MBH0107599.1 NAD(+)/NADH kinase [Salinibacterium sp. NSLL17]